MESSWIGYVLLCDTGCFWMIIKCSRPEYGKYVSITPPQRSCEDKIYVGSSEEHNSGNLSNTSNLTVSHFHPPRSEILKIKESANVLYITPNDNASMRELLIQEHKNVQGVFRIENWHLACRIWIIFCNLLNILLSLLTELTGWTLALIKRIWILCYCAEVLHV